MAIVFDKPNRYGLIRIEGVEYACDCFASGTDPKGNKVVKAERWHMKEIVLDLSKKFGVNLYAIVQEAAQ